MEQELIAYLSTYTVLSAQEIEAILALSLLRKYDKGTILLREGEVASACYLVLRGCIRSYYLVDGEEKTTEFYTENHPVTPVSYIQQTPSAYYLSCVEDCVVCIGSLEKNSRLIQQFSKIEAVSRIVTGELLANQQVGFDNFRNLSPQKRYLKLLETRPDLCFRVPQYQLASYLGIKPESLSRIRKRIKEDKL